MKQFFYILIMLMGHAAIAQHVPSFEEVISLRSAGTVIISPDGKNVAFTVQTADWKENRYDTEIWLSKNHETPFQFTNSLKGSSTSPRFSPDGKWIAFLSDRGNKTQIQVMNIHGGEPRAVTQTEEDIISFQWHPDGNQLIFSKAEPESKDKKERDKRYGGFEVDDKDFTLTHLWKIDFKPDARAEVELPCYETVDSLKSKAGCIEFPKPVRLTEGDFTVTYFKISPDGKKIAFNHQPDPFITSMMHSDISILDLADHKITPIVQNISTDNFQDWSPDSKMFVYTSNLDDTTSNFYKNPKVMVVDITTNKTHQIATSIDEVVSDLHWVSSGIYASVWNKTLRHIHKIDPKSGAHDVWLRTPEQIYGISFSKQGEHIAFLGKNGDQINEIFTMSSIDKTPKMISDFTSQIKDWKVAQSEVISWKSKDGEIIEGVLLKPQNYDPTRKYPLLVVIHGGPTAIDAPTPVPSYVYPIVQWLDKGSLVLRVNYRGSAGYGERFRSLNVNNLGVGDAWDVLSGVEYLDKKGMIDKNKMGCMGWSQGGYISAFLTTNSDVFKAISVGAGISNWMTYYVNTDIHPFTRQYLKSTPWSDEAMYKKTSPMTNINKAKTPTLIQHGEFDKRVPTANAYELVQGLRDRGVPSELIIYKGFGHGINKPKERLAATWHNWQWFNKYVWGEEVELPLK